MSTAGNEKLVVDFYAALSKNDLETVRMMLHPDATWTPMVQAVPGAGVHRGRSGIVDDFLAPIRGLFEAPGPRVEINVLTAGGTRVVAETRGIGRLKNGKPYDNQYCWVFEISDGTVLAIREYMDSHYVMSLVD